MVDWGTGQQQEEWSAGPCYYMDTPQKHHCAMWKKYVTKDHILHDSIYMKCLK